MKKRLFAETLNLLAALTVILMYFYMLDLFQPYYVILHRGVTWLRIYDIRLTDGDLLGILPLIVVSIILIAYYATNGLNTISLVGLSTYSIATLIVINILPLFYWITYMYNPNEQTLTAYDPLPYIDTGLFHVYAPVYPLLLLATLYAWLPTITIKSLGKNIRLRIKYYKPLNPLINASPSRSTSMERLSLTSIILLSIALPLIPHLPTINPAFKPVSVDIYYYSKWLDNMLTGDAWNAIDYAFYGVGNGNRPLYLLLLYSLTRLGVPRHFVLNLEALFIAPFFALAVYYTAKHLSRDVHYAFFASLAGLLGFNMTVGMYAGFYAAWMALMPFYICVMLTPSIGGTNRALIGLIFASIVTLYIHPWTWALMITILTFHLIIQIISSFKRGSLYINKNLLLTLLLNVGMDIFKTVFLTTQGGLISTVTILTKSRVFGFNSLLDLSRNLNRLTNSYVGGLFFNPLHILLALIGVLAISTRRDEHSKLLLLWIIASSLIFPLSDINLQSHILFALPFPIVIAEGLQAISSFTGRFDSKLPNLIQVFFLLSSSIYTVRALCNII